MDVRLVEFTGRPVETMMYAFMNMHFEIPSNLDDFIMQQLRKHKEKWPLIMSNFVEMLSINPHNTVLEYVNTVWYIGGVSRAFQQQLTRTRAAAYCIQSLRIVNVETFADDGNYYISDTVKKNSQALQIYSEVMRYLQNKYKELLSLDGLKTEDARGILPLNINSPITMSINLRALAHLAEARLCYLTQGEYRDVVKIMIDEVCTNIHPKLLGIFKRPCEKIGRCMMPVNCGKTEYRLSDKFVELGVKEWLK